MYVLYLLTIAYSTVNSKAQPSTSIIWRYKTAKLPLNDLAVNADWGAAALESPCHSLPMRDEQEVGHSLAPFPPEAWLVAFLSVHPAT
jgi:hypothetical protein